MSRSSTKQPASVKLNKARKDTLTKQLDFDRKAMVEAGLHDSLQLLALIAELSQMTRSWRSPVIDTLAVTTAP
ncbi:MAG: hypothetical protein IPL73_06075 [Candidatus Obscuribacter sp.]|nr:hypothetical protein [Candidatus Obscuribacter sp.]